MRSAFPSPHPHLAPPMDRLTKPSAPTRPSATSRRTNPPEPISVPTAEPSVDLTELMDDWFFGTGSSDRTHTNLETSSKRREDYEVEETSGGSSSGKLTEEWLEEARRMVASSPSRLASPSRTVGSPRFVTAREVCSASILDRRDPLSRSARRHRALEGFSKEILSKSAKHNRNKSEGRANIEKSQASAVKQWFNNIIKPNDLHNQSPFDEEHSQNGPNMGVQSKQPRRRSRFQDELASTAREITSKRSFKNLKEDQVLSPPKNLVESLNRRSISSSTCSIDRIQCDEEEEKQDDVVSIPLEDVACLNSFLKKQRRRIEKISRGEMAVQAKILLSGSSNGASSMVAAICYAWLLQNEEKEKEEIGVIVPVMNMKRGRMWKHREAARLFHDTGIDAMSLLFSNEVDLESLVLARRLSILVIGQDVLKPNSEVVSPCTLLTDNYCEHAYELLQAPYLKKLMLAGILLDTQNLNASAKLSMNRDAEAVQLLLVGMGPNYRNSLYDRLTRAKLDNSFQEILLYNYGDLVDGDEEENRDMEHRDSVRKLHSSSQQSHSSTQTERKVEMSHPKAVDVKNVKACVLPSKMDLPKPAPTKTNDAGGKNKFFLAKWFGFGSK
ncbi:uncharacterized protein LOC18442096 [Amborella trichopoda]|uniref:DHHA2 domain-containing protein n=1 Tax=Amborella trichopoda TaxID=13333 RepID=W1PZM0_AMBTC|nr:uncharacterized protein LOC18442096 [Amborella trichopoda]ERN13848.1 hypothetical protein AMTR_s00049p00229660 [Amborella trichopoda]|eukprot:XP_006852381.3 uncharacterized protein LOC18442096 [Amborella trichopoda]